jgi:hypothetical protein
MKISGAAPGLDLTIAAIRNLVGLQMTDQQIGDALGLTIHAVRNIRRRNNIRSAYARDWRPDTPPAPRTVPASRICPACGTEWSLVNGQLPPHKRMGTAVAASRVVPAVDCEGGPR